MNTALFIEKIVGGVRPEAAKHLKIEASENKNKTISINVTYYNRLYVSEPVTAMLTRYNAKDDTLYFRPQLSKQLEELNLPYEKGEDGQCYVSAYYFAKQFDFLRIDKFIYPLFQFDSIGCCGKYKECSKKQQCIHDDLVYANCCMYRKNLEAGKIFYGEFRNV